MFWFENKTCQCLNCGSIYFLKYWLPDTQKYGYKQWITEVKQTKNKRKKCLNICFNVMSTFTYTDLNPHNIKLESLSVTE